MITRPALRWWTNSDQSQLLRSQSKLFEHLVPKHHTATFLNAYGVNAVAFDGTNKGPVCVLAHGFGSGLGFFNANVDRLLVSGTFSKLILVDWMGMGGSDRPPCWNRPYRTFFRCSSWCDSYFSTEQSIDFFIDPLEKFLEQQLGEASKVHLVGHSLGGYLAARYALKYPARLSKLILASPVGFPHKPENALSGSQLPTSIRLIDGLWSANVTPQTIVRIQGSRYGKRNVKRVLKGRIPGLSQAHADLLSEYLYHITVAPASGEFAMNSLLEPAYSSPGIMGVFARLPLQNDLVQHLAKHIELRVNFGDSDWMRANEPSARETVQKISGARLDVIPRAGHHLYLENDRDFVQSILT